MQHAAQTGHWKRAYQAEQRPCGLRGVRPEWRVSLISARYLSPISESPHSQEVKLSGGDVVKKSLPAGDRR